MTSTQLSQHRSGHLEHAPLPHEIAVGDRAWLQIVGPHDPGIYYIASITSVPYETSESEFGRWRSDIRYDFRVEPPLLRVEAAADPVLAMFAPLRGFQGTLARVPNEIVARLEQLTEGRRVPLDRAGPAAHELDVNRAIELHNLVVRQELKTAIRDLSPSDFEHLVGALLRRSASMWSKPVAAEMAASTP